MANLAYQIPLDFAEPVSHHTLLHQSAHGAVLVWEALANAKRWTKIKPGDQPHEVEQLLSKLAGQQDTYISVNEFDGWRLVRLLRSLRACYVDIDLAREATSLDLDAAREALHDAGIPAPSIVVFSGRGMHLYWLLKATPAKALPVWQRVQDTLLKALAPLGADKACRDCTRVLRLAGTVNSKTGTVTRGLVLDGVPWSLHQLADEVLGYRPPPPEFVVRDLEAQKARRNIKPALGTLYARWYLVMQDLHRIGQYWQSRGGIPEGNRDKFLFLSSVALSWFSSPDAIVDEVKEMSRLYAENEHKRATARLLAARGLTQTAIAAELDVSKPTISLWLRKEKAPCSGLPGKSDVAEPVQDDLRAIITDDTAKIRKKERDSARYANHYTGLGVRSENEHKRATARLLAARGLTQTAIAAELDVSKMTISLWLRKEKASVRKEKASVMLSKSALYTHPPGGYLSRMGREDQAQPLDRPPSGGPHSEANADLDRPAPLGRLALHGDIYKKARRSAEGRAVELSDLDLPHPPA